MVDGMEEQHTTLMAMKNKMNETERKENTPLKVMPTITGLFDHAHPLNVRIWGIF